MKWVDRYKASRRGRRKAALQREIRVLEDRINYKLSPDYDHAKIRDTVAELTAKRRELVALDQEVNPNVQP